MKGQVYLSFMSLTLLLALTGCGGGQSNAKLEVSRSFAMANPTFAGGLLIHGTSSTGKNFTLALDTDLERTIKLDNGSWSFFAIGWDGGVYGKKLVGNRQCGMINKEISGNTVIELSMNAANCSDDIFQKNVKLHEFKAVTCGTFNSYNSSNNTYSPITESTPDNFCHSLPIQFKSQLSHYKVVAMEMIAGVPKRSFESGCFGAAAHEGFPSEILGFLPTTKFPFLIQAYASGPECQNTLASYTGFSFLNGLESGSPDSFDHLLLRSGSSPTQSRLILPSSITRRGKSLFMNSIPQFLCDNSGLSDCFSAPSDSVHVMVDWNSNDFNGRKLLKKHTSMNSCPSSMSSGNKFSIANCYNEEGNLYGAVVRNGSACPPGSGTCSSTLSFSDGSSINIKSIEDSTQNQFVLFEELFNLIGLRNISSEYPFYLFRSLHESRDDLHGGGQLRRVQQHLSSTGILAMVRTKHATCSELLGAVSTSPLTLDPQTIYDPFKKEKITLDLTVSKGSSYDLRIDYSVSVNGTKDEKGIFDLMCDKPKGKFETFSFKDSEIEHELYKWDTQDVAAANVEVYSFRKEEDQLRAEVTKLQKLSANEFWSRKIESGLRLYDANPAYASVSELHKYGGKISTTRYNASAGSFSDLASSSDTMITQVRDNSTMYGTSPAACMYESNSSIYTSYATGCSFSNFFGSVTTDGFVLHVDELFDIDTASPQILEKFSIK